MIGLTKKKIIFTIISTIFLTVNSHETINWDQIIHKVNNHHGATWKAGHNFPSNTSVDYYKGLHGTILDDRFDDNADAHPSFLDSISDDDIPDSFDARVQWPECKEVISHIRDQGACGSCWAVAAASAFTDQLCIAKKLDPGKQISSDEVLGCTIIGGCYGGFLRLAWFHIKHSGSRTGGDYGSDEGCLPYSIPPCEHHGVGPRPPCTQLASTPKCGNKCTNIKYQTAFKADKYYAKDYHSVKGEKKIQKAILANGPVEAGFTAYEDFGAYKNGVYHHITGKVAGGHAVKIIGWGTEDNTPYWLIANSWNLDWGDNGYFKILRGKNECGIEKSVYTGTY